MSRAKRRRPWLASRTKHAMQVTLHLVGNRQIRLDVEPEAWTTGLDEALRDHTFLQVKDPESGGTMGVNPRTVLYWITEPNSPGTDQLLGRRE